MHKKDDNYLKKELYELIKKDESIFDFIQLSSLDGLWYWDIENPENEWMNARFWETLGYNPDEMPHLSSAWQNIINPDDLQVALENFNKHVENPNHPYDQIVRYTHKNGSVVWIRCRGLAIRDANGKVIRMLGAHHDITEIKKNELELLHFKEKASDSEEKYKALFLNAPLSYQSLNEDGCFIDVNPMWLKTLGYDREEVIGSWFGSFLHPEYVEHFKINFPAFKKRGSISDVQFKLRKKDGNYIHVSFEGCVGYNPDGKFRQTYCVFKDITAQKEYEEKLIKEKIKAQENEKNYKFLFNSTGTSNSIFDIDFKLILQNDLSKKELGLENAIGKTVVEIFGENIGRIIEARMRNVFSTGNSEVHESKFNLPSGIKWFRSSYHPILNDTKEIIALQIVSQNITEIKKTENLLIEAKEKAEASEEKYSKMVEILPDGVVIHQKGIILFVNNIAAKILKVESTDEIIGKSIINFLHKDFEQLAIERQSDDYVFNNKEYGLETILLDSKGNEIQVLIKTLPFNYNGLNSRLTVFTDITNLKRTEEALIKAKEKAEENEAKYSRMVEILPDGVIIHQNGKIVYGNNTAAKIMKAKSVESLIGKSAIEFVHPDYRKKALERIKDSIINKTVAHAIEEVFIDIDGNPINVYVTATPFVYNGIDSMLTVFTDITNIKETEDELIAAKEKAEENEKKLIQQNELFNVLINNLSQGVFMVEVPTGKPILANDAALKILGRGILPDTNFKNLSEFYKAFKSDTFEPYPPNEMPIILGMNGEYAYIDDMVVEQPNGKYIYLEVFGAPVKDAKGNIWASLASFSDITERKNAQNELIAAKEKAEENHILLKIQTNEIELQNERLESLLRISQYQTNSIQELLDFALEEAIKLTDSKIGYIYFYNESNQQFVLNTWSKEVMRDCRVMEPKTIYELSKTGIWGEAVRQRKPILINDFQEFNTLKKEIPEGHVKLSKFLTIPVIIDNVIVAVAGVANKETNYNNSDIRQLTLLMDAVWKISERITLIENLKIEKEKALESEEKHKFLFENTIQGVVYHDSKGEIIYANKAAERILGLNIEQLKGLTSLDPRWKTIQEKGIDIPGELHPAIVTLKTGKPVINAKMGVFNPEKNEYKWININSLPKFRNNETTPYQVAVTFEDITERKQYEELLRISAEKWETTFNSITDIISVVSKDHEFIEINKAGCDSLGMKREDIIGKKCYELVHHIHNPILGCPCVCSLATNEMGFNEVYDNGRYYLVTVLPIHNQDNEIIAFSHSAKDITDKKIAELELIKYKEHLEELVKERTLELVKAKQIAESATRAKSEFLANMSHEIRTPMNAIMGFSELLTNSLKEEDQKLQALSIHRSALNLLDIINDILDLSKIEAGRLTINKTKINLQHFFEDIKTLFTVQAQQKDLDLHIEIENELPKSALIDEVRLRQVLINLIGNAIKFTEKGHVILTLSKKINFENYNFIDLIINVEDTGIGIPEDQQKIIFEPFILNR